MTAQTDPDLVGRLEELESRVRTLEDTDAIRNLKARYAELCDDNYNPDGIAALFVEDAVWESGGSGPLRGQRGHPWIFPRRVRDIHLRHPLQPQCSDRGHR